MGDPSATFVGQEAGETQRLGREILGYANIHNITVLSISTLQCPSCFKHLLGMMDLPQDASFSTSW